MHEKVELRSFKEKEPNPIDVSKEFLEMDLIDFRRFLKQKRNQSISITIDNSAIDPNKLRQLKAFLESGDAILLNQRRLVTICATQEEYDNMPDKDVFNAGAIWQRIEELLPEKEIDINNVSQKFLTMESSEFRKFLRNNKKNGDFLIEVKLNQISSTDLRQLRSIVDKNPNVKAVVYTTVEHYFESPNDFEGMEVREHLEDGSYNLLKNN